MSANLEELDYQNTAIGELILRRRRFPALADLDVFEVILNEEFLMSSLFTDGEIALASLSLDALDTNGLDVIVGGLGLGYTGAAVLTDPRTRSLTIIDALAPVIQWHERRLLPASEKLVDDPRCTLYNGDFFELCAAGFSAIRDRGGSDQFDAVLLDIDHSPNHLLNASHGSFYTTPGLQCLRGSLVGGGVFGLWSNDPVDGEFLSRLDEVFRVTTTHQVVVENPLTETNGFNTVYVAIA